MPLLFALFLVVHACIHIGYICGPAWPFVATDPWLVTALGVSADAVRTGGIALVLLTLIAYLLAALTVVGLLPRTLWRPLVAVAAMASAVVLTLFVTPWTVPGIAFDTVLLWATLVAGWHPTPFFGSAGRSSSGSQEALR